MDGGVNSSAAVKNIRASLRTQRALEYDKCTILRKVHFCCSTDFRLQAIAQLRENAEAEVFWISTTFLVADLSHRLLRTNRRVRSILNSTANIHRLHLGVARTGLQNMPKIYPPPLL
jgi:hypothetical protein